MKKIIFLLIAFCSLLNAQNNIKYLFTFDTGQGQNMPGWTWHDDVNYGHAGWTKDSGQSFQNGWGPRMFDEYNWSLAEIDTSDRAPGSLGGCFRTYMGPSSFENGTNWWMWYSGTPLSSYGYTDSTTNRMSFYLKLIGTDTVSNTSTLVTDSKFHVGTYLCWDQGVPPYGSGDGCPYESEGQHWYHHINCNPGTWIHVLVDQHPNHIRGVTSTVVATPDSSFLGWGYHYLQYMHQFYFSIRYTQTNPASFKTDNIGFYTLQNQENDISIATLWVGYWQADDHWEIGWSDCSFGSMSNATNSTFEVRWSETPITTSNFYSAHPIHPYTNAIYADSCVIRRASSWMTPVMTKFTLDGIDESNINKIYFAVKDVSVSGTHVGSYPYQLGDGHNAPSSEVHTIDYALSYSDPSPILNSLSFFISDTSRSYETTLDTTIDSTLTDSTLIYIDTSITNFETAEENAFYVTSGLSWWLNSDTNTIYTSLGLPAVKSTGDPDTTYDTTWTYTYDYDSTFVTDTIDSTITIVTDSTNTFDPGDTINLHWVETNIVDDVVISVRFNTTWIPLDTISAGVETFTYLFPNSPADSGRFRITSGTAVDSSYWFSLNGTPSVTLDSLRPNPWYYGKVFSIYGANLTNTDLILAIGDTLLGSYNFISSGLVNDTIPNNMPRGKYPFKVNGVTLDSITVFRPKWGW